MTEIETDTTITPEELQDSEFTEKRFEWTRDRIILAIIFIAIILVSIALLIMILVDNTLLFRIVRDYIIIPIDSLHLALQVLIFLGLMILQSLFPPIPSELVLVSGGILFGWAWGSVIGVVGSMFSAAVTFYIAKRGGRSLIEAAGKKSGIIDRTVLIFDLWIKKWGMWAIIVGRAVPVIMFDPISYAAGLAKVKDGQYFLATLIGSIPRAIFYGWVGLGLDVSEIGPDVASQFNKYFFILFGVLIFMFILSNVIYYIRERRKERLAKEEDEEKEEEKAMLSKEEEKAITSFITGDSTEVTIDKSEDKVEEEKENDEAPEQLEEIIDEIAEESEDELLTEEENLDDEIIDSS
ncbi:MAG: TVP38/TMEM64 family protein [Asgard group archaeon]|nr:TVP38/TMEM64 family protein [Asgard group archaeon]